MSKTKRLIIMMLRNYGVRGDWSSVDEAPLLQFLISEIALADFEANGPTHFNQNIMDQVDAIMNEGEVGHG